MNGNKKYLDMLIGALIVIVLGVLIYFGYTFYNKTKLNNNPKTTTTLKVSTTTNDEWITVTGYPKANDNSVTDLGDLASYLTNVELKTNFTNLEKFQNGYKVIYNCTDFSDSLNEEEQNTKVCKKVSIEVNNTKYETGTPMSTSIGCGTSNNVLIYKDKTIIYEKNDCTQTGNIKIYANNTKWLVSSDITSYNPCDSNLNVVMRSASNTNYIPRVLNSKLYFISIIDSAEKTNNLSFGYVDLDGDNVFNEIKKYTGEFGENC